LNHLCLLIVLPVFQTGLAVATGVLPNATLEHPAHRLPISPPGRVTRWALNHLCLLIVLPVFQTGLAVATGVLPNATLEYPAHRLPISPPGMGLVGFQLKPNNRPPLAKRQKYT